MKRLLVLLFGIVLVVGCWGCSRANAPARAPKGAAPIETDVVPVWIDAKFTDREKADVDSAIDAWNSALNGYVNLFVVSDKVSRPCEDPEVAMRVLLTGQGVTVNRDEIDLEDLGSGEVGRWDPDDDSIHVIADRMGFRDLRRVVMHEFGHHFIRERFPHLPRRGSLMFPIYEFQSSCVDWETGIAVAETQQWDVRYMWTCDPWGKK
jgi:hypothetical protein